jgi:hypothetical protein
MDQPPAQIDDQIGASMPFPQPDPDQPQARAALEGDAPPPIDATSIPTGGGDALSATVLGDDPAHPPSQILTGGGQALGNPTTHVEPGGAR